MRRKRVPTVGWLIKDVAAMTEVPARTIRSFVEKGLIGQPSFFGTQTRYSRDFVVRVLVIKALRARRLRADALERAYRAMSAAELDALAATVAKDAASTALGFAAKPSAPEEREPWQDHAASGEWWFRVQVLKGLEITIGKDASPLARRLARQFITDCIGAEPARSS